MVTLFHSPNGINQQTKYGQLCYIFCVRFCCDRAAFSTYWNNVVAILSKVFEREVFVIIRYDQNYFWLSLLWFPTEVNSSKQTKTLQWLLLLLVSSIPKVCCWDCCCHWLLVLSFCFVLLFMFLCFDFWLFCWCVLGLCRHFACFDSFCIVLSPKHKPIGGCT